MYQTLKVLKTFRVCLDTGLILIAIQNKPEIDEMNEVKKEIRIMLQQMESDTKIVADFAMVIMLAAITGLVVY